MSGRKTCTRLCAHGSVDYISCQKADCAAMYTSTAYSRIIPGTMYKYHTRRIRARYATVYTCTPSTTRFLVLHITLVRSRFGFCSSRETLHASTSETIPGQVLYRRFPRHSLCKSGCPAVPHPARRSCRWCTIYGCCFLQVYIHGRKRKSLSNNANASRAPPVNCATNAAGTHP